MRFYESTHIDTLYRSSKSKNIVKGPFYLIPKGQFVIEITQGLKGFICVNRMFDVGIM